MMIVAPQVNTGISVPVAVKTSPEPGVYDPAPCGTTIVFDSCGDCRLIWPADLVIYSAGPDDWFCPLCTS